VFEQAALLELHPGRARKGRSSVRLTTFRGSGLQPGVDLDDSAALQDLMDGTDAADGR
jgi:hypothetical protein